MRRRREMVQENPQLLTLVHGVDFNGRPLIRAYTGNACHPVYQEYQGIINKQYQKAARLAEVSRSVESPYGVNNSYSDFYSESGSPLTPRKRVTPRWTPSISVARSPTVAVSELKGMQAMLSRLRCSLAIHAGLGPTNSELNFLPVIPVRVRKTQTMDGPKKGSPKVKIASNKQDLQSAADSRTGYIAPQARVSSKNTEHFKEAFSELKKTNKRKVKKAHHLKKLKPKFKPIADIVPLNVISSKYLLL